MIQSSISDANFCIVGAIYIHSYWDIITPINKKGGATMSYNDGGFGRSNRGYGRDRGYGGNRRFDDGPKPVETGKEYDVSITEISRKGDGIARVEGFVIFVKDGKAGQNAKIKITQVGGRFASAEIVGSSQPAAEPAS